jgi:sulfur relay (sulfurtransferase) complex TusBCD TusD component (DsrE family)
MTDNTVILVTQRSLGAAAAGDEAFGSEMLDKFFHTLESRSEKPKAICFYTKGVKVVCEGSPHLLGLRLLERLGVRMLVCKTCLSHYGIADKLAVGETGGMTEIVQVLAEADKVITV